jgi:hypothetical protein
LILSWFVIIATALTAHAIITEPHPLVANANALRCGFMEDVGQTVQGNGHGFDYTGEVKDRIRVPLGNVFKGR